MKGSYILIMHLSEQQTISIGSLSEVYFPGDHYAYVGSALGGVKARLSHHLNKNKKSHWHIDYLLQKASITDIIVGESEDRVECTVAQALSSQFDYIPGFGSSDCRCPSHLFFAGENTQIKSAIMTTFESLAISPKLVGLRSH